jgi:hypothetical protein
MLFLVRSFKSARLELSVYFFQSHMFIDMGLSTSVSFFLCLLLYRIGTMQKGSSLISRYTSSYFYAGCLNFEYITVLFLSSLCLNLKSLLRHMAKPYIWRKIIVTTGSSLCHYDETHSMS